MVGKPRSFHCAQGQRQDFGKLIRSPLKRDGPALVPMLKSLHHGPKGGPPLDPLLRDVVGCHKKMGLNIYRVLSSAHGQGSHIYVQISEKPTTELGSNQEPNHADFVDRAAFPTFSPYKRPTKGWPDI